MVYSDEVVRLMEDTLPDLAVLSIMLLSWADTSASVFGRKFGKYTPKLPSPPFATRKSLAGTMGAFFFGGFSAYLFYKHVVPIGGNENDLTWMGGSAFTKASWIPDGLKRFSDARWITLGKRGTGFPDTLTVNTHQQKITVPVFWKLPQPVSTIPLWQVELVCAVAASLAEGLDIYGLDDNVILPVLSGLMIWAALWILG